MTNLNHAELVLLLLFLMVAALAFAAKRLRVPYPIVLVTGGLLLSLIPRVPRVTLDPDVVFLVILPPLVFSAAFNTTWWEFRQNLASISMLAFGLVGFTIFGVAATTRFLLPGFDWKLGLVLGSVVAATDAIAATAIAKRLGLPRRIVALLEAESLVNDGSGLVALKFTLAMVVAGVTPTLANGAVTLLYLVAMAILIGLFVGVLVSSIQRRISDAPIEITISLMTSYFAYLGAESAHCSGVLATLACGLYMGKRSSGFYSLNARIESVAFWRTLDFIFNGIVFLLLGLQLPEILAGISSLSVKRSIVYGALFSAIVILLRLLWMYPSAWIPSLIRRRMLRRNSSAPSPRELFIVGWGGMRGVLALAAALSLPERLRSGESFPNRNLIIFLTFCVIFSTLILQGLSMPTIIRRLGLAGLDTEHEEEELARREMITAALHSLEELRRDEEKEDEEIFDRIEWEYRRRLNLLEEGAPEMRVQTESEIKRQHALARRLRDVERSTALKLRNDNKIHDEVLRLLERELDLADVRFTWLD